MADFIPILDIETMIRRKQFAHKYFSFEEKLIHSIFVDEQRFCFSSTGEISLHCGSHGKSVKNSVSVWSCIMVDRGPNVMKKLNSRLDTSQYKELLGLHVLPYCNDRTIVHDYFPVHTSKSVSEFITRSGMKVIEDWPRKSGDLMPLETVWREMIKKLAGTLVFNENDLWCELHKCWIVMDREAFLTETIYTLPKRLVQVVKAEGGWLNDF